MFGFLSNLENAINSFIETHPLGTSIVGGLFLYVVYISHKFTGRYMLGPIASFLLLPVFILYVYLLVKLNIFLALLLIAVLFVIFFSFRWIELEIIKSNRDSKASKLFEKIKLDKKKVPPYCLYLRSFFTTNALFGHFDTGADGGYYNLIKFIPTGPIDLETILNQALRYFGTFVALGEPGEMDGAGRIKSTEDEWRSNAIELMKNAKIIIIFPSDRKSLLWEMTEVKDELKLLDKTIWFMPEESRVPNKKKYFNCKKEWKKAQIAFKKRGVLLPNYLKTGMIFRINKDGIPFDEVILELTHVFNATGKIRKIIKSYGFEKRNRKSLT